MVLNVRPHENISLACQVYVRMSQALGFEFEFSWIEMRTQPVLERRNEQNTNSEYEPPIPHLSQYVFIFKLP